MLTHRMNSILLKSGFDPSPNLFIKFEKVIYIDDWGGEAQVGTVVDSDWRDYHG